MALTTYLTDRYSVIYNALGWTSFDSVIEDALELYDVDSEAQAAGDLTKLHRLADYVLWKQALREVSLDHDFSADGASYSRSQTHKMIMTNLEEALENAKPYLSAYQIDITEIEINNPYDYSEDRDNLGNF